MVSADGFAIALTRLSYHHILEANTTHPYIALRLVWCWRVGPQCDKHTWAAASSWAHPEKGSGPCCCPRLVISVVWPPLGRGARSEGGGRVGSSSCCGCSSMLQGIQAVVCFWGIRCPCSICIGGRAITSSRRKGAGMMEAVLVGACCWGAVVAPGGYCLSRDGVTMVPIQGGASD